LVNYQDYAEMHGQQNIKITVFVGCLCVQSSPYKNFT